MCSSLDLVTVWGKLIKVSDQNDGADDFGPPRSFSPSMSHMAEIELTTTHTAYMEMGDPKQDIFMICHTL